jgi:hypothetical protein
MVAHGIYVQISLCKLFALDKFSYNFKRKLLEIINFFKSTSISQNFILKFYLLQYFLKMFFPELSGMYSNWKKNILVGFVAPKSFDNLVQGN